MRIKELKGVVLRHLHDAYEEHGSNTWVIAESMYRNIPTAKRGSISTVLTALDSDGVVEFVNGGARLTAWGIEQIEDPSTEAGGLVVQSLTINGGNVQVGSHNHQTITYRTVVNELQRRVAMSQLSEAVKGSSLSAIQSLIQEPALDAILASVITQHPSRSDDE